MKKIGLVVQRYGLEVNGGAEYHCRILAEKLNSLYDVEVLTTCARDHFTWANAYPEGITVINGVQVNRFGVAQQRNKPRVHRLLKRLNDRSIMQKIEKIAGIVPDVDALGDEWSKQQGPYVPELIDHLRDLQEEYEVLIFFTYLYFPAFFGLRVAPAKSILIPTAHDEPAIHLPVFKKFFNLPRAILYNTPSERDLVNRLFDNGHIYSDVAGIGINTAETHGGLDPAAILKSAEPYLIYIGRIDPGKGCDMMIAHFMQYKNTGGSKVKLVLLGKSMMEIPQHPDVLNMGFVDETVKQVLLRGAKALIMPSHYESLSLVTLESMQEGVPVIANEYCEVLKDHVRNSQAGFTFRDFRSFKEAVDQVLAGGRKIELMRVKAKEYVSRNYNWDIVLDKFKKAIDFISG